MIVIAAFTQLLSYWLEYRALVIKGVSVSSFISFGDYLRIYITSAHMKIGRAFQADTGEVGSFGYWLAVIDFIGFLLGGLIAYFHLREEQFCEPCGKYLKTITSKNDTFPDTASFGTYYDTEFNNPVDSPEFAAHVGAKYSTKKSEQGAVSLQARVLSCPQCGDQIVSEKVQIFNGKEWKDVTKLDRHVAMPTGCDVAPAYGWGAVAKWLRVVGAGRGDVTPYAPLLKAPA